MEEDVAWVPMAELSRRLSVKVPTVRYWLRRGMVPPQCYVKIGQTYRFDVDAVIAAFRPQDITSTDAGDFE